MITVILVVDIEASIPALSTPYFGKTSNSVFHRTDVGKLLEMSAESVPLDSDMSQTLHWDLLPQLD